MERTEGSSGAHGGYHAGQTDRPPVPTKQQIFGKEWTKFEGTQLDCPEVKAVVNRMAGSMAATKMLQEKGRNNRLKVTELSATLESKEAELEQAQSRISDQQAQIEELMRQLAEAKGGHLPARTEAPPPAAEQPAPAVQGAPPPPPPSMPAAPPLPGMSAPADTVVGKLLAKPSPSSDDVRAAVTQITQEANRQLGQLQKEYKSLMDQQLIPTRTVLSQIERDLSGQTHQASQLRESKFEADRGVLAAEQRIEKGRQQEAQLNRWAAALEAELVSADDEVVIKEIVGGGDHATEVEYKTTVGDLVSRGPAALKGELAEDAARLDAAKAAVRAADQALNQALDATVTFKGLDGEKTMTFAQYEQYKSELSDQLAQYRKQAEGISDRQRAIVRQVRSDMDTLRTAMSADKLPALERDELKPQLDLFGSVGRATESGADVSQTDAAQAQKPDLAGQMRDRRVQKDLGGLLMAVALPRAPAVSADSSTRSDDH